MCGRAPRCGVIGTGDITCKFGFAWEINQCSQNSDVSGCIPGIVCQTFNWGWDRGEFPKGQISEGTE